jgi:hypothetical protein
MTSLLSWLLVLYTPLGVLQLFLYSRKPGQLILYKRLLVIVFFVVAEMLATGYVSSLFFDMIRHKGLRCANGVVGLWALSSGAMALGLTLLSRNTSIKPNFS